VINEVAVAEEFAIRAKGKGGSLREYGGAGKDWKQVNISHGLMVHRGLGEAIPLSFP
jgi:hypothetical protein